MNRRAELHGRDDTRAARGVEAAWPRALLAAAALAFGCEGRAPLEAPQVAAPAPSGSGSAAAPVAPSSSPAGPRPLSDPKLRWALDLPPPLAPAQGLAFAKRRLARVAPDELLVYDVKDFSVRKHPVAGALAVVPLPGGSLLALGRTGLRRLDPGREKFVTFPRMTLFGVSMIYPDRARLDRVWVRHGKDASLYGYELDPERDARLLAPASVVALEGASEGPFTSLRDGSFLYATASGLRRFVPGGRLRDVAFPPEGVWSLLPCERLDRVWIVERGGGVGIGELAGRSVRPLGVIEVEPAPHGAPTPYAAASEGRLLAVLFLLQPPGRPKSFRLDVFDTAGKRVFSAGFPPELTEDEEWAAELSRNGNVALSVDPPLVAAGGPARLRVWNHRTSEAAFEAP